MRAFVWVVSMVAVGAVSTANAQFTSSKLESVPGSTCVVPGKYRLTIQITSQRIANVDTSGIFGWFKDPANGVATEFDVKLTSPSDNTETRTFPAAKTVSVDGSNAGSVIRVVNQFAPIRQMNLQVKAPDGTPLAFASIDADVFMVLKTGDSAAAKLVGILEKIGGAVPADPWAPGLQLYGNLADQVLTSFATSDDSSQRLPLASISLQLATDANSCDGMLHDGVNVIVGEAPNGLQPRTGEAIVQLSKLDNECLYATNLIDPDIVFADKVNGACPTNKPDGATILGNPQIIFKVAAFPIDTATRQPLPNPTEAAQPKNISKLTAFDKKYGLNLSLSDMLKGVELAKGRQLVLPNDVNATAWTIKALATCKKVGIPANQCL